jgi:hypothetical protein
MYQSETEEMKRNQVCFVLTCIAFGSLNLWLYNLAGETQFCIGAYWRRLYEREFQVFSCFLTISVSRLIRSPYPFT